MNEFIKSKPWIQNYILLRVDYGEKFIVVEHPEAGLVLFACSLMV